MNENLVPRPLQNPFVQFILLLAFVFVFIGICSFVCLPILSSIFGIENPKIFLGSVTEQSQNIPACLFTHNMIESMGLFFFPALFFALSTRKLPFQFLQLNTLPSFYQSIFAIITMVAGAFFIVLLIELNTHIPLPKSMSFLRTSEESLVLLQESFFNENSMSRFALLTFCVAVVPAISEELFFRGILQKLFLTNGIKPIFSITITAAFFALAHMHFDNTLAIFCLGSVLGFICYFTNSLWASILAHFFNNFFTVCMQFAVMNGWISKDLAEAKTLPLYVTLPAGAALVFFTWIIYKTRKPATMEAL